MSLAPTYKSKGRRRDRVDASVVVVKLGLEVDSSMIIRCSCTVEHIHLAGVFVDDSRRRDFYGACRHCRFVHGRRNLAWDF
jgi:hypothetical protein